VGFRFLGFSVESFGFRVQGSGWKVRGSGFRAWGFSFSGFGVDPILIGGRGRAVQGSEFRVEVHG